MQYAVQVQQLLPLALHQLSYRYTGPTAYYLGYLLLGDAVTKQAVRFALLHVRLSLGQLFLQLGQLAVLQLGSLVKVVAPLGLLHIGVKLFYLCTEGLNFLYGVLLVFPLCLEPRELLALVSQLFADILKVLLRYLVAFLVKGGFLYLQLHYVPALLVKLGGHAVHLGAHHRAGLIHKVDSLIRQEPVAYVPVGERGGGYQGAVLYLYAVEHLVALLQPSQYAYGILHRRLVYHYGLEPSGKGGVLFDVLAVLVQCGRAYAVQFAPCQHRLQQVARVHAALGASGTNYIVQLIDEQYYPALAALYFIKNGLKPFLEFAPELCARNKRTHVKGEYLAILQVCRHIA